MIFFRFLNDRSCAMLIMLSAFLLFSIQPLFGKIMLPQFGGTPSVWNTALVFYQGLLFCGYLYAFVITRYISDIKIQFFIHLSLLAGIAFLAPFETPNDVTPSSLSGDFGVALIEQLAYMAPNMALPYFILSSSAPLLQFWYTRVNGGTCPYYLYSYSNAGSLGALIAYPFVIEALLPISDQIEYWMLLFVALVVFFSLFFIGSCRIKVPEQELDASNDDRHETYGIKEVLQILLLSAVPCALLVSFTTYITTDIASLPLLWVLPLALYLLTFIIAFNPSSRLTPKRAYIFQAYSLFLFVFLEMVTVPFEMGFKIMAHLLVFFSTALVCHQILYRFKGHSGVLNQYYVWTSLGGMLGSLCIALLAPILFSYPIEYPLLLVLAIAMRYMKKNAGISAKSVFSINLTACVIAIIAGLVSYYLVESTALNALLAFAACLALSFIHERRWIFAFATGVLLLSMPITQYIHEDGIIFRERSYFGVIRVRAMEYHANNTSEDLHLIVHGTTVHGMQSIKPGNENIVSSYYGPGTGAADSFKYMNGLKEGPQHIGIVGMGIGSVACYTRDQRTYDLYEIDPIVIRVAEDPKYFTQLTGCGTKYEIIQGDARIELEKRELDAKPYDLLFIDAYASDSIPLHLVTKESFDLYLSTLKDDGLILVNVSNNYLELRPEMKRLAGAQGLHYASKLSRGGVIDGTSIPYNAAIYVIMSKSPDVIEKVIEGRDNWVYEPGVPEVDSNPWTDDFSNILRTLKF